MECTGRWNIAFGGILLICPTEGYGSYVVVTVL